MLLGQRELPGWDINAGQKRREGEKKRSRHRESEIMNKEAGAGQASARRRAALFPVTVRRVLYARARRIIKIKSIFSPIALGNCRRNMTTFLRRV
jgi:hypothetical protein